MNLTEAAIRVVDFETTGFDSEKDKLCEVGWCDVYYDEASAEWMVDQEHDRLINPGMPIPPVAMAVHHITDDDVREADPPSTVLPKVFVENIDLYVAHNAEFDGAFAKANGQNARWMCTYRLALHVFPDAPSHKNQVLRYWLGLHDIPGDAHRAGHDARITAEIFCHMMNKATQEYTIDSIIAFSEAPVFLRGNMNFGKHKDVTWAECPRQYLIWMRKQGKVSDDNPDGWSRDQWFTLNKVLSP